MIAVIRGRDPVLRGEAVVVGALCDHVGRGVLGSRDTASERTRIHIGADDNASGTAALPEIDRILAASPPLRSIVIVGPDRREALTFVERPRPAPVAGRGGYGAWLGRSRT